MVTSSSTKTSAEYNSRLHEASIIFGKGVTGAKPGSMSGLVLAVTDIDAARAELSGRGADVSEVFHFVDFPFNNSVENSRLPGRDPDGRSYFTFASFKDVDGNEWLLQEVTERLPGREWKSNGARAMDVPRFAELLHEAEQQHGGYEKTHARHNWWDWYAPYIRARQNGTTADEAATAAGLYMEKLRDDAPA